MLNPFDGDPENIGWVFLWDVPATWTCSDPVIRLGVIRYPKEISVS